MGHVEPGGQPQPVDHGLPASTVGRAQWLAVSTAFLQMAWPVFPAGPQPKPSAPPSSVSLPFSRRPRPPPMAHTWPPGPSRCSGASSFLLPHRPARVCLSHEVQDGSCPDSPPCGLSYHVPPRVCTCHPATRGVPRVSFSLSHSVKCLRTETSSDCICETPNRVFVEVTQVIIRS